MSGKNCWPGPTGLLSLPHRTPQHPRFFEGEKMIFKPSNMLLASFFASNFLDENKSRQQREFVFGSSISPPEKARIFSYKKMYSNISLLSTWVALAGNRHKTPRDSSSTAKRHLYISLHNVDAAAGYSSTTRKILHTRYILVL